MVGRGLLRPHLRQKWRGGNPKRRSSPKIA
jgi:hypothetical protein